MIRQRRIAARVSQNLNRKMPIQNLDCPVIKNKPIVPRERVAEFVVDPLFVVLLTLIGVLAAPAIFLNLKELLQTSVFAIVIKRDQTSRREFQKLAKRAGE